MLYNSAAMSERREGENGAGVGVEKLKDSEACLIAIYRVTPARFPFFLHSKPHIRTCKHEDEFQTHR